MAPRETMGYIEHIVIMMCVYIILSVSLNLITGFTGMLNLGHAAFFGIGAYTSAILVNDVGVPWILGLFAAAVISALGGLLIGIPGLRLRGDYFAIATLGFGEIFRIVAKNWEGLTRGTLGMPGIHKPELFGFSFVSSTWMMLLVLTITIVSVLIMWRIIHSPFGRILKAIREDELAAKCLGKNVVKYKLYAMAIGSGFAGIAGSLFAHYFTYIDPGSFTFIISVYIISMVVLGGMGSISGSIIGAIIIIFLPEPIRFLHLPGPIVGTIRQIIYSLLLIVLMIYRPHGLFGESSDKNTGRRGGVMRLVNKIKDIIKHIKEKMTGVANHG